MDQKMKIKLQECSFLLVTNMMLPKDLLGLVFWELDHGHDMLNFSEISRGCNQIFHQNIEVVVCKYIYNCRYMVKRKRANDCPPKTDDQSWMDGIRKVLECEEIRIGDIYHGLYRSWDGRNKLECENNNIHGMMHGTSRTWYSDGHLNYIENYHYGQKHGRQQTWDRAHQLVEDKEWYYGEPIEK